MVISVMKFLLWKSNNVSGIGQFMRARTLMEVLEKMEKIRKDDENFVTPNCVKNMGSQQYQVAMLHHSYKETVIR